MLEDFDEGESFVVCGVLSVRDNRNVQLLVVVHAY
jgi:hypothetical protein